MADIKINVQVVEGQAKAALKGLDEAAKQTDKSINALNLSFKGTSATTIAFGNIIATTVVAAVKELGSVVSSLVGGGVELETQIQNLTGQFKALLPATKDAKKFLSEINELSDKSPFEFPELADAAKTLLTFGINAERVSGVLTTLGDIATASGADINQLALTFAKASEAGSITTRELNQLRNSGIPVIQALATELGITNAQVKDFAEKGKIDIKTFERALISLGEEGGFAFQAMANKAQTLSGAQKRLFDSIESLQGVIGKALAPAIVVVKNLLSTLIDSFVLFLKQTNAIEIGMNALVSTFRLVVQGGAILYNTFNGIRFVLNELAAGISYIAVTVINQFLTSLGNMVKGVAAVSNALGITTPVLDKAADSIDNFKALMSEIPKTFHESAQSVAKDITATSNAADQFATSVEDSYINLATNMKAAATGVGDAAVEVEAGITQAQSDEKRKRLEAELKFQQDLQLIKNEAAVIALEQQLAEDAVINFNEQLQLDAFKFSLQQKELEQQAANERRLGNLNAALLLEQKLVTNAAKFEFETKKKLNAEDEKLNQEKAKNQKDTYATIATLASSNNQTLAAIGKAAALTQIAIDGPIAVTKALAAFPPPFNFVAAGAVAAAVAAQAARVVGVKFADGGIVPGNSFSGDTVSARLNSGEMVLNKSQQANLFNMANSGGAGGQIIQVNNVIELDGEVVARSVSRQVANGLKLGEVV
jgi:tape measure domain-containing protein